MGFKTKVRKLKKRNTILSSENKRLRERIVELNRYSKFDILDLDEEEKENESLC